MKNDNYSVFSGRHNTCTLFSNGFDFKTFNYAALTS